MSEYNSEVNGLTDVSNINRFIDIVTLYKYSKISL